MTSQNASMHVPPASIAAVRDLVDYYATDEAAAEDVRLVAAPVVAAELRRIADAIDPFLNPEMYGGNDQRDPQVETLLNALFARARELDPTGHP